MGSARRISQSSVWSGRVVPYLLFPISLLWIPCLGMRRQVWLCAGFLLLGQDSFCCAGFLLLTAKVSAYADDITVFVSRRLDIKAVKATVTRYEQIGRANINFDKSEGLRLGAWRGGVLLTGPFRWSNACPHPQGEIRDWPPTGAKLFGSTGQGRCPGGYLASKDVVLRGQVGFLSRVHLSLDLLPFVCTSSA